MLKAYFTFRVIVEFIFKGELVSMFYSQALFLSPSFFEELLNIQSVVKNLICTL